MLRCSIGKQMLVFEYELTPNKGKLAIKSAYIQPPNMNLTATPRWRRRFNCMAYVIANQRSMVINVSVKMDNSEASTVMKPVSLQPIPMCRMQIKFTLKFNILRRYIDRNI